MSLRIAFDLDGTLADLDSALDAIARELFPAGSSTAGSPDEVPAQPPAAPAAAAPPSGEDAEALTPEEERLEPPEVRALSRREQHLVWEAVRRTADFWEGLAETEPGIVARVAALAEARRWEVIFVTQRPGTAGDTTQRQTQRWLAKLGFGMPSVFVLDAAASRGKVAAALGLDVVVDDRSDNCLDVKADSQARAFLVARGASPEMAASAARLGIEVVPSTGRCLDILTEGAHDAGGLLGRLRRALGRTGQD